MAKSIARFLVAVMAVAAMALASVAGTGLAQAQMNTPTDQDALVTLYNATSGDNWANNDMGVLRRVCKLRLYPFDP